jgi:hypothetical protein
MYAGHIVYGLRGQMMTEMRFGELINKIPRMKEKQ